MASTIPIQNIYYMLSYAYKELKQANYARVGTESFEHVYDLLAAILAALPPHLLRQGQVLSPPRAALGCAQENRSQRGGMREEAEA